MQKWEAMWGGSDQQHWRAAAALSMTRLPDWHLRPPAAVFTPLQQLPYLQEAAVAAQHLLAGVLGQVQERIRRVHCVCLRVRVFVVCEGACLQLQRRR